MPFVFLLGDPFVGGVAGLKAQLHAGRMPTMTARRPSLNVRGQRLAVQKRKLKRKAGHVSAAMRQAHERAKM